MVFGHLGVALGARAARPNQPLAWLVAASFAPDLVDAAVPAIESCNAPGFHSHSLPAVLVIATVFGLAARWRSGNWQLARIVVVLIFAHVLADYVTGSKVLWSGGPIVGLNLYDWPQADFALEATVIGAGWWLLRRAQTGPNWARSWIFLAGLLSIQALADLEIQRVRPLRVDQCRLSRGPTPGT